MKIQLLWFKRDLRVVSNTALIAAAEKGPVLPIYIAEPDYWAEPDTSARQWDFIRESLLELRTALSALGQPLVVRIGNVVEILSILSEQFHICNLWSHVETGNAWTFSRDQNVAAWCKDKSVLWTELPQNGVVRGLSSRDGWARNWETFMTRNIIEKPVSLTSIPKIAVGCVPDAAQLGLANDYCPNRQQGGRSKGLELLNSFLDQRVSRYRTGMSSPVTAETACSRLSPHAAYGTLSLREIVQATKRRREFIRDSSIESTKAWSRGLSSFSSRLHWHCHFIQKLEDQVDIEWRNMHPAYDHLRGDDPQRFLAWSKGETGWPFVDACMRMLHATGWINFRMRAMLIAIAGYHLWIDWRKPGEHLARLFTDYEPGIHWPQVQMQSGTTGINLPRIYNPIKQGYEQDPSVTFVRLWIPELNSVPDKWLHEPWTWSGAHQHLGNHYPYPIVNHLKAAKLARHRIWAIRNSDTFKENVAKIQTKHGGRSQIRKKILSKLLLRKRSDKQLTFCFSPKKFT